MKIVFSILLISEFTLISSALVRVKRELSCAAQFKCQCSVSDENISCDYGTTEITMKATFDSSSVRVVDTFMMMNTINITKLDNYFSRNVSFRNINIREVKSLTTVEENAFWSSQTTLETLRLTSTSVNSSESLFRAISKLVRLSELVLDDNQIEVIPDNAFGQNQTQLKMVYITRNKIKYLGQSVFEPLIALDYIDLNSNLITSILNHTFTFKSNTKDSFIKYRPVTINIRLNQITDISESAFLGIDRPIKLDISFNNLTSLSYNTYKNMLKYESTKITVRGNKVKCDCDIDWILHDKIIKEKISGPLRCADKRYLSNLSENDLGNCTAVF